MEGLLVLILVRDIFGNISDALPFSLTVGKLRAGRKKRQDCECPVCGRSQALERSTFGQFEEKTDNAIQKIK